MATFTYNATLKVSFDDRVLAHLQAVITATLRRRESVVFSWATEQDGGGRTSIWLDRTIPMVFEYSSKEVPELNVAWIDQLTTISDSPGGLQILPEPVVSTAGPFGVERKQPDRAHSGISDAG